MLPDSPSRDELAQVIREGLASIQDRIEAALGGEPSQSDALAEALAMAETLCDACDRLGPGALGQVALLQARVLRSIVGSGHALDEEAIDAFLLIQSALETGLNRGDDPELDGSSLLAGLDDIPARFPEAASSVAEADGGDAAAVESASETASEGPSPEVDALWEFQSEAEDHIKGIVLALGEALRGDRTPERLAEVRERLGVLQAVAAEMGLGPIADAAGGAGDALDPLQGRESIDQEALGDAFGALDALLSAMGMPGEIRELLPDPAAPAPNREAEAPAPELLPEDWDDLGAIDPELCEVYTEEAREHLALIGGALGVLREEPGRRDALKDVRRSSHTLKGAAGAVKLKGLSRLAYRMEKFSDYIADRGGDPSEEDIGLLSEAHAILEGISSGGTREEFGGRLALAHQHFDRYVPAVQEKKPASPPPAPRPQAPPVVFEAPVAPIIVPVAFASALADEVEGMLASASSLSTEILEVFAVEAEDHLRNIYAALTALERQPDNRESLQELQRSVHTLKGAAGAVKHRGMTKLAHRMEDLLGRLILEGQSIPQPTIDVLMRTSDLLMDMSIGRSKSDGMRASLLDLLGRYDDALQGWHAVAEPEAAEPEAIEVPADLGGIELDDLNQVPAEVLEVFALEAEDHLRNIYSVLSILEKHPAQREALTELQRSVHTLKGAAGAARLTGLTSVAHRMEDLLEHIQKGNGLIAPEVLGVLTAGTDVLLDLSIGQYDQDAMRVSIATVQAGITELLSREPDAVFDADEALERAYGAEEEALEWAKGGEPSAEGAGAGASRPVAGRRRVGEVLRVPLDRVDELVRLVSELMINRTAFEQRMADMVRTAEELRASVDRMRKISNDLETQYEVDALRTRRLAWLGDGPAPGEGPLFRVPKRLDGFDELEMDRYTQFHLLTRSLAETAGDLNTFSNEVGSLLGDFGGLVVRQGRLTREIQDKLMRVRMVPLSSIATQLQRTVRGVAGLQDKQVELVLEGEHIELDKTVLEEMAEPFLHLLRNAVDHGIESPNARASRGKPERATIAIRAQHEGTQVVLQVADDGRGIDPEHLKATAVRNGHLSPEEARLMSREEALQLIFRPGFSTAREVSEVSGRGVGMDIVRSKIHKLKGTLTIDSEPGKGTTFTVRLPMTLAITRALLLRTNGESYAVPVQTITQLARVERESLERIGRETMVRLGDRVYPVVHLGDILKLRKPGDHTSPTIPLMVVTAGDRRVAVAVDELVANREIVVKTLGSHLRRVHGLIGATLLGDGSVVPILNMVELIREPERAELRLKTRITPARPKPQREVPDILVVDDSVSVRRVVCNLLKGAGWNPIQAKDGVDALEILQRLPEPPALVLLDVEMPRMDGYELLASLRGQRNYEDLPVVMLTSRAGQKHRQKAMDLGASDYAVKPFQDDALLAMIRGHLGSRFYRPEEAMA